MAAARRHQEYVLEKRKAAEAERERVEDMLKWHSIFEQQSQQEEKVRHLRLGRQLEQEREEEEMLERLHMEEKAKRIAEARAMEEMKVAEELKRRKEDHIRQEKIIQRICDEAPEIQDLKRRLDAARASKERELQLAEKRRLEKEREEREREEDEKMEESRRMLVGKAREKEYERMKEREKMKEVMEEELAEREKLRRLAEEEFLREKEMVDAIVSKIEEEDRVETEAVREKKAMMQRYIADFLEEQEQKKIESAEREREEEERIRLYLEEKVKREEEEEERKKAEKMEKERIFAAQAKALEQQRKGHEELQDILLELHVEERELRDRQAALAEQEKRSRAREEMMAANEYQKRLKAEREAALRAEEDEFRRQMLEKFAEDARLDQLSREKQRRKMIEYRKEVDRMVDQRRAMLEREKERARREREEEQRELEMRQHIISEKRKELLETYAADLIGHLPRGVFMTEDDLSVLPPELQDEIRAQLARRAEGEVFF
eukprot:TRINITY_DN1338_c0_g1_i1.p1 TRINITY_DN1338_c0_g1~~TRINITY_DN1338_c0_g1_i1.p1  ORF type:complete len:494 (-),score=239.33 TRINITY_DN1338_c0_g1_i1:869-2350(-)